MYITYLLDITDDEKIAELCSLLDTYELIACVGLSSTKVYYTLKQR